MLRYYYKQASLRLRMLISIALPLFLLLSGMAFLRYYQEQQIIREGVEHSARHIGEILVASLQHAMMKHDIGLIGNIISSTSTAEDIARIQLIDENAKAVIDTGGSPDLRNMAGEGCVECHRYPAGSLPWEYSVPGGIEFRVAKPIANTPECNTCHDAGKKFIGVLLVDITARQQLEAANTRLLLWLVLSLLVAVVVFLFAYWRMQRVFASRIESLSAPLAEYGNGNLAVRLPVSEYHDEIDQIAIMFNQMADELEFHVSEKASRDQLLQRTIIEERERIARELHDSLPQLLAYLTAKLGAISLYVESGKKGSALENLAQLETAIKRLFSDIREAIIGLRMSRQITKGLIPGIKAYIEQFTQLCGLKVDFSYDPVLEDNLDEPQTEIHLLRIVQEGLSNVRKYAKATHVSVSLLRVEGNIELAIQDDGVGFDPETVGDTSHFGLQSMRERAEACGGVFVLESHLNVGTKIMVRIPTITRKP